MNMTKGAKTFFSFFPQTFSAYLDKDMNQPGFYCEGAGRLLL